MSDSVRVRTGAVEPIRVFAVDGDGNPLTGLTDLFVRVSRASDGFYLDWAGPTFAVSGWTTLDQVLTEVDAVNAPGIYEVVGGLDTGAITNAVLDDDYLILPLQSPGTNAVLPAPAELKVGQTEDRYRITQGWVDVPGALGSLDGEFALDLDGELSIRPTATLTVEIFSGGASVFGPSLVGTPDVLGLWRTSIPHASLAPSAGTLLVALVTISDAAPNPLSVTAPEILSIPSFTT